MIEREEVIFKLTAEGEATKQGKLIHELVEQFGKAKAGYEKGSRNGYVNNHKKGVIAENSVNGNVRCMNDKTIGRGIYQETFKKNNKNIYYNINTRYPIIKVNQLGKQ